MREGRFIHRATDGAQPMPAFKRLAEAPPGMPA